MQNRVYMFIW